MNEATNERRVDHAAIKVNQICIITLLLLAFVLDYWPLAGFVGLVMLVGTLFPPFSLFKLIYGRLLKPAGIMKPQVIIDNPEPHRFAQGLGSIFVALAAGSLLAGQALVGWSLAWVVIVLAALNLFIGFCAGCFVYYQLNRLGIPGFDRGPVIRS